ncbi:MAG: hypothetical protein EBT67_11910 [Betaproteobacteria bacterium]|nr:hypothetical protein [Betaproteobacteria bacterium]
METVHDIVVDAELVTFALPAASHAPSDEANHGVTSASCPDPYPPDAKVFHPAMVFTAMDPVELAMEMEAVWLPAG